VPKLILEIEPYVGEYEFEVDFTNREFHRIKLMCGLRAGEIYPAFEAGDTDVAVALAAVILSRHGVEASGDILWDAPAGKITFDFTRGIDAAPPPKADQTSSGGFSKQDLAPQANDQSSTGDPR
jgi:hypothetical protein